MPNSRRITLVLSSLALCFCTGAAGGEELMVLRSEDAARYWQPVGAQLAAPWPASDPADAGPACVHLGFRIDARGHTSDFSVVRRWTRGNDAEARRRLDEFSRSAAAAISTWQFAPRAGRARPVYTSANLGFAGGAIADSARAPCDVEDFPRFVTKAQRAMGQRGSLMEARMDTKRQADPPVIPFDKHDWFDGPLGPGVQ
jgi:hypothetical protein